MSENEFDHYFHECFRSYENMKLNVNRYDWLRDKIKEWVDKKINEAYKEGEEEGRAINWAKWLLVEDGLNFLNKLESERDNKIIKKLKEAIKEASEIEDEMDENGSEYGMRYEGVRFGLEEAIKIIKELNINE